MSQNVEKYVARIHAQAEIEAAHKTEQARLEAECWEALMCTDLEGLFEKAEHAEGRIGIDLRQTTKAIIRIRRQLGDKINA